MKRIVGWCLTSILLLAIGCEAEPEIKRQPQEITVLLAETPNSPVNQQITAWLDQSKTWFESQYQSKAVRFVRVPLQDYERKVTELKPDVVVQSYASWADYQAKGLLMDLTPLVKNAGMSLNDYYPESLTRWLASGSKLYGIPVAAAPYIVVGYSKTWFDRANLAYPKENWTWEDFAETAKKLKAAHAPTMDDPAISGAVIGPHYSIIEAMAMSKGGSLYSTDAKTANGYLNGKPVVESMQWIKDLSVVQKITPPLSAPQAAYQVSTLGKSTGMLIQGVSAFDALRNDPQAGPQIGIVGLPHFKDGRRVSNLGNLGFIGISSTSRSPELAWEYIRSLTMDDTEVSRQAFALQASVSLVVAKALRADQDPFVSVWMNELKYAEPSVYLKVPKWNTLSNDYMTNEITRLALGDFDLEQGLTRLAETTDRKLAEAQP